MKRFAAPDLSGLDSSATGTVRDADSNGDGRLGEFGQRNVVGLTPSQWRPCNPPRK
jgi:hypothetical protein